MGKYFSTLATAAMRFHMIWEWAHWHVVMEESGQILASADVSNELIVKVTLVFLSYITIFTSNWDSVDLWTFKDVPGGIPKSDLLGVTVARIHGAGQWFLAVWNGLYQRRYSNLNFENCLCRTTAAGHEAVFFVIKSCATFLNWLLMVHPIHSHELI